MKRSTFLKSTSILVAGMFDLHFLPVAECSQSTSGNTGPLIKTLRLQTTCSLAEMRNFYQGALGLRCEKAGANSLLVNAGPTKIYFEFVKTDDRPFYHFAFNIPENKIDAALAWQREKTPVIHPNPSGPRDAVVNFNHWNAHSVFFLDPAGNLLEYIARHDLRNAGTGSFTSKDILYVSEIGFVVDDIESNGNLLMKQLNLPSYRPSTPGFWPIGSEHGLLLMLEKNKVWSSHQGQVNKTGIFKTDVEIDNSGKPELQFDQYPYKIINL